jgi:anion-transporting  ArsA/GET3 family ATPase
MTNLLTDPAVTGVVVTTTPEEMPVNETLELIARLDSETDIDVAAVVANRVLPELFGTREEAMFDRLCTPEGRTLLAELTTPSADTVLDAAELAVSLRRSRATHLARLREELPEHINLVNVPYLFTRSHGMRTTRQVADYLGEELL